MRSTPLSLSHARPASARTAVVIAAAALLLTGCVGGSPDDAAPPAVTIDEVAVPDSMMPSGPAVTVDSTMVPAADGLPALVGGGLAQPGTGAVPTVWASPDGSTWTPTTVDTDFTGSFSGDIAGSSKLAALAGVAWDAGASRTVLWTSKDRQSWTPVELPEDFATTYLATDAAVSGSTVIVIATSTEGESRGIRVEGKDATVFDLPAAADGEELGAGTVVARDKQLVLIAAPGPEGEPADTVAYSSDDLGDSWGKPATITDKLGYVSGVAVAEDGFVATGAAPRGSDGGVTGAAAWFSSDGKAWAAENVPAPADDGPLFYFGSADAWFGAPVASAGVTVAFLANDNAALSGVYQRSSGGGWTMLGQTSVNPGNGIGGFGASLDGSTVIGVLGEASAWRPGIFAGGWSDIGVFADRDEIASAYTVQSVGDRVLATLTTPTFTVDGDLGWRNSTVYGLGELSGDSLTPVDWDPARAGELTNVRLASDGDAELVVGSSFPAGASVILAEAYFRPSPDAEWTQATGFEGEGATFFYTAAKIGDQWVAVGQNRASSAVGEPEHGTIWTSADGVTWSKPAGDFGSGALESSVADVCELPDGTGVAVGWVEESAGQFRTAVWMPEGDAWKRVDIGEIGTKSGSAGDCATGEDGVIIAASISGRDTLQLSTDGTTWTETFRADRGITLGEPVAVDGGFAASGSLVDSGFAGPVVWLSEGGKDWSPVSVSSYRQGSTIAVAAYGKDLVVVMGGQTGHPVSIVRDIAKVISG